MPPGRDPGPEFEPGPSPPRSQPDAGPAGLRLWAIRRRPRPGRSGRRVSAATIGPCAPTGTGRASPIRDAAITPFTTRPRRGRIPEYRPTSAESRTTEYSRGDRSLVRLAAGSGGTSGSRSDCLRDQPSSRSRDRPALRLGVAVRPWTPFGRREVLGVVQRFSKSVPATTRSTPDRSGRPGAARVARTHGGFPPRVLAPRPVDRGLRRLPGRLGRDARHHRDGHQHGDQHDHQSAGAGTPAA